MGKTRLLLEQWVLIEWTAGQAEPQKYYLSTLPETTALSEPTRAAHICCCIERNYQDSKEDLGLGHYEGGVWRGFSPSRQPEHRGLRLSDGVATEG